jgi:hypothetical protein
MQQNRIDVMLTGQIYFIVSVDVDCEDDDDVKKLTTKIQSDIELAFPEYKVEVGDQDVEEIEDA